jgi:hypothetical protein
MGEMSDYELGSMMIVGALVLFATVVGVYDLLTRKQHRKGDRGR